MKRFKAGNVRVRGVEGVAPAVVEAQGLKRVAAALGRSGLVQVEEGQRVFGMHQLLQQAVGRELGWGEPCARMRRLLHARCGQFGDEERFDVGLYGVMREVAAAAVAAAGRVKAEGGEAGDAWCSGMLLRLYDVAREVYGTDAEFPNRVLAAAHGSLVGDLVGECVMREGCTSAGRRMTLRQLLHAAPHLRDVVAKDPAFKPDEDDLRFFREEMAKGASEEAAWATVIVRRFDVGQCVEREWGRAARARLLAGVVRAHVMEEGGAGLPLQAVAAVQLVREVAGAGEERAVEQLLRGAAGGGVQLVAEEGGGGGWRVAAAGGEAGAGWRHDGRALKAMRWKLHTLVGDVESAERMMGEIGEEHAAEAEGGGKWELGVALGAACHVAGGRYNGPETRDKEKAAYERALRMRLDALGEQHPATAATLASLGTTYGNMGDQGSAIMLCERALRIFKDTLGPHPATAFTMSSMGAAYGKKGQSEKAIELFQQALRIYESTVGRMHRDAALAIYNMSVRYYNMGDFARAEELGLEAEDIYTKTLGKDHKLTKMARDDLEITRQQKAKVSGRGLKK